MLSDEAEAWIEGRLSSDEYFARVWQDAERDGEESVRRRLAEVGGHAHTDANGDGQGRKGR